MQNVRFSQRAYTEGGGLGLTNSASEAERFAVSAAAKPTITQTSILHHPRRVRTLELPEAVHAQSPLALTPQRRQCSQVEPSSARSASCLAVLAERSAEMDLSDQSHSLSAMILPVAVHQPRSGSPRGGPRARSNLFSHGRHLRQRPLLLSRTTTSSHARTELLSPIRLSPIQRHEAKNKS